MRALLIAIVCILVASCSPRDTRPDGEKLADFRARIADIDRRVTAASDAYTRASNAALDRGDHAALDNAAVALQSALTAIRPDAKALKTPEFASAPARDHAEQVRLAVLAGIDANRDAAIAVGRIADIKNPTGAELSAIQEAKNRVSQATLAENNSMFSLFIDLGVPPGPPR
jgi:hypothetical protein